MKRFIIYILLAGMMPNAFAQDLQKIFSDYLKTYTRADARLNPTSTLESCSVNDDNKSIRLTCGGGFGEQFFTEEAVNQIYRNFKELLPKKYKNYKLTIVTDRHAIEELIPNAMRHGKKDKSRRWEYESKDEAWVKNLSRPYSIQDGLDGTHISLWQSHGKVYRENKGVWEWQRPRLYCTTEDLFSQTFVIPFIIPMLENAGATVYTPRERDWQRHEVIVDNDAPKREGLYLEDVAYRRAKYKWHTSEPYGFARIKNVYYAGENPFTHGTARYVQSVSSERNATIAQWVPNIPEEGRYAVYVSYQSFENSVKDARYTVFHKGGITEFSVNQQMGGSTWVYLGTFEFDPGEHDYGMVVLSNVSKHNGIVSADAVRFGGGMGNIARGSLRNSGGTTSGLPRWAEAARYSTQWAGMPDSVCDKYATENDYNSDINSRPLSTNELSGGSVYMPNSRGRKVPIELSMAFHTDAGYFADDTFVGSLSICSTDFFGGKTDAGVDRYVSRDLCNMLLANLNTDLKQYKWQVRKLWNRNYGETRMPQVPSVILEMLSHQNFADMRLGYDPQFKFDLSRSVYKTVVKYLAEMHNRNYVIQPLPVKDFAITLNENKSEATLSWEAQRDPLEPTANATGYVVYMREGYDDFDNGRVVHGNSFTMKLVKDKIYSFRVCALNKGGKSFPSETLSVCNASRNEGTVLIVNAFTRLSGPAVINTETRQGFDLDTDPGVPYGAYAGFCGRQIGFDRANIGSESTTGLGYSGSELEGKVVMGNTFDYVFLHGKGIQLTGKHSFISCSESAFLNQKHDFGNFKMLDVIYGVQKNFNSMTANIINNFCHEGGRVFVSGANLYKNGLQCPALKATLYSTVNSKSVNQVSGSGLNFGIYRELNGESYAVPQPEAINPTGGAFAMLAYSNGLPAAVAYDGSDYKAITFGFPLESITDARSRNRLMEAVVNFLCR